MQTLVRGKPSGDLVVALQALERGLSAELVATGAIGGAVQGLVGPRQRARRNLSGSWRRRQKQKQKKEQRCGDARWDLDRAE